MCKHLQNTSKYTAINLICRIYLIIFINDQISILLIRGRHLRFFFWDRGSIIRIFWLLWIANHVFYVVYQQHGLRITLLFHCHRLRIIFRTWLIPWKQYTAESTNICEESRRKWIIICLDGKQMARYCH